MNELKIGQKASREQIVTEDMLAVNVGSGSVKVLATPVVSALMEGAAADLAQQGIEDIYTTVGACITVNHLCPTAVGVKVKATATLTGIEGRKFHFDLQAEDNAGIIANGTHTRVSVKRESFAKKAEERKNA